MMILGFILRFWKQKTRKEYNAYGEVNCIIDSHIDNFQSRF